MSARAGSPFVLQHRVQRRVGQLVAARLARSEEAFASHPEVLHRACGTAVLRVGTSHDAMRPNPSNAAASSPWPISSE